MSLFDLHVHTLEGSVDSDLEPAVLVEEVQRLGLTGAVLTEHDGWRRGEFDAFARRHEVVLIHALEAYTNMGHVITFGLDEHRPGMRDIRVLRKYVEEVGGYMILAHPFRFFFGPHGSISRNVLFPDPKALPASAAEAATHPVFEIVDAIEAVNGGNMEDEENVMAHEVALELGHPGTAGSDAHSRQGIGRGTVLFHGEVRHERDLLEALRANAYTPVFGYNSSKMRVFGELPDGVGPVALRC
jgi:predicted metal-dependent phosphoesterase TrpH